MGLAGTRQGSGRRQVTHACLAIRDGEKLCKLFERSFHLADLGGIVLKVNFFLVYVPAQMWARSPMWAHFCAVCGPTPGADAGPVPAQNSGPVPAQMWRSNLVRLERVSRHRMDELHMSTRMRAYPQWGHYYIVRWTSRAVCVLRSQAFAPGGTPRDCEFAPNTCSQAGR
jgi:hypothetical protein